jgi:hypothetical protein
MSDDSRHDRASYDAVPRLRHSYCATCHRDAAHVVTLCGSQGRASNPRAASGVTDPECVVCIDLLTQAHRCANPTR